MQSCLESATYLHNLGFSDAKIAAQYGVRREHICKIRNGNEKGSEELRELLDADCRQARAFQAQQQQQQQPSTTTLAALPVAKIVDAAPPMSLIPYDVPRNSRVPMNFISTLPAEPLQQSPPKPSLQERQRAYTARPLATFFSLFRSDNTPDTVPTHKEIPQHPSLRQRIQARLEAGKEIEKKHQEELFARQAIPRKSKRAMPLQEIPEQQEIPAPLEDTPLTTTTEPFSYREYTL